MNTLSEPIVDGGKTQKSLGEFFDLDQTHIANKIVQGKKAAAEKAARAKMAGKGAPQETERRRVTPGEAKLRVLTDSVYVPFDQDFEPVAALRIAIAMADDESGAIKIYNEIKWRQGMVNQVIETLTKVQPPSKEDSAIVSRFAKERLLLSWTEATLARRRSEWSEKESVASVTHAQNSKKAIEACAQMFRNDQVTDQFSAGTRLAFAPVIRFNLASAEWALRKAEGKPPLEDEAFLRSQLTAYEEAFNELNALDRKAYRAPRALALRACLEMAVYLNAPQERRYLSLFAMHLDEAKRAKTAVQWYLANYIQEIEQTLKKSLTGRPGWNELHNI